MTNFRTSIIAAACALAASPIFADAGGADFKANLYDADYEVILAAHGIVVGADVYGANDADYGSFFTTAATFNPLKFSSDAGYEALIAEQGIKVGTAVYGSHDADYGAVLTPVNFFETAALGQFDAGYEVVLQERGIETGTAVFGAYDADYEAILQQPGDCANCF